MAVLRLLNPVRFEELFDDFGDEAPHVIDEFVAETERAVARLQGALADDPVDPVLVASHAHRLKGGCMMVGAQALQELATELDALGKQGAGAGAMAARGAELGEVWAHTRAALLAPR